MTVRLTFVPANPISWAPGQHFLINIPSISRFTTHPFTCGSIYDAEAPEDAGRSLVFFIRAKNGWTKDLWDTVVSLTSRGQFHQPNEQPPEGVQVPSRGVLFRTYVDGPFGSVVRARFEEHSTILIVAGGSGVSFGLSLLIYVCNCLAGRDGKNLGGRAGGWGKKGYRTTRVRFIWIVRDFGTLRQFLRFLSCLHFWIAHIVWCATAIRRCLDRVSSTNLQIDIFVTNFKRISDKKTGPPSPLTPATNLPGLESGLTTARASTELLYAPAPRFARSGLDSRSSSVESLSTLTDNTYVDLTYFTNEYGDEERDPADPDIFRQNYIIDLTNFEGETDLAIGGEDVFNRRVMKTGKARRAKTRKAAKVNTAKKELEERSALATLEGRGRQGRHHMQSSSGDMLSPEAIPDRRRSARSYMSQMSVSDSGMRASSRPSSRQGSRPPSRAPSPTLDGNKRLSTHSRMTVSDHMGSEDPTLEHGFSPYHKELGMSGENASLRGLVTDTDDLVRLEVEEAELRDVSVVSEHTRAGRPKLERILSDEVETANGSILVTCEFCIGFALSSGFSSTASGCGPTPLNALVRKAIAAQINPARVRKGDMRGSISLVADEFNY